MKFDSLTTAIADGKLESAVENVNLALKAGLNPQTIISDYLILGMEQIGQRFSEGKAYVPNLLMSGRAMKGCLEILRPLMIGEVSVSYGKVVIGTVKGDLHDIGKNLVATMFEGCGFEVINVGIDVSSDKFIEAVKENNADILCLSALLTTTMTYMEEVIKALDVAGLRQQVKVMIGGAPLSESFAKQIGADAYTSDANSAILKAKQLLGVA
ncbi:MAG: corrinoid protein [Bacteroidales bacterium]|nr:corrinoid protein [Bacteroidales bacterium]